MNLQRLDAAALRRYRRFYKLPDVGPNSTKEQLLSAISRHFSQQVSTIMLTPVERTCAYDGARSHTYNALLGIPASGCVRSAYCL